MLYTLCHPTSTFLRIYSYAIPFILIYYTILKPLYTYTFKLIYYTHTYTHIYTACLGQLKENKRRGRLQLEGRKNVEETKVCILVHEYYWVHNVYERCVTPCLFYLALKTALFIPRHSHYNTLTLYT